MTKLRCYICDELLPRDHPLDHKGKALPCQTCLECIKQTVEGFKSADEGGNSEANDPDVWEEVNNTDDAITEVIPFRDGLLDGE